jgi:SHS2 domain-containing protein
MDRSGRFKFLEHTADAYIAAYGRTLSEAFENAGLAVFEVMTDLDKVNPRNEESIEVNARDAYELLYNWLEALLVKFDIEQMLFSKLKVLELREKSNDFRLKVQVRGERFDPEKHVQKVGVKAVTYHRMEIIQKPNHVTLKFILDL